MDLNQKIIASLLVGFFIIALIRVFRTPLRVALKLLLNTLLGFLALWAVNLTAAWSGVSLPVSLLSLGVAGLGGIPGVVVMLSLRLLWPV